MRTRQIRAVVVAALAMALVAAACGKDDNKKAATGGAQTSTQKGTVTIGAFNFPESAILANIYANALRTGGYTANVRPNLGSREVVEPALERGEIDLYPGYAATELEFVNKGAGEATPDAKQTVDKLRARLEPKGLTALEPSTAVDQNAFAVTKATAQKYSLKKLSDLSPVASQLTLGGPPECPTRPFCQAGLESKYGLKFKAFKALDAGGPLSKAALENGDVDVALIFSSDGAIPAKGFVVLDDDKQLQNADAVVPVISKKAATAEVTSVLNKVSSTLTTEQLAALNKSADVDKQDPDTLAQGWARDHGFLKK